MGTPRGWEPRYRGLLDTRGLIESTFGLLCALFTTGEEHRCYWGDPGRFMGEIFIIGIKMLNLQRL